MSCEDGLFIFFIVFYWQNVARTFAVLWNETTVKTIYNLASSAWLEAHPVAGFGQDIEFLLIDPL